MLKKDLNSKAELLQLEKENLEETKKNYEKKY